MGVTTQNSYYVSPPIVTNGLVLYLDVSNNKCYISGSSNMSNLVNASTITQISGSLTYNNNNAASSLYMNGVSQSIMISCSEASMNNMTETYGSFTYSLWFQLASTGSNQPIVFFTKGISANGAGQFLIIRNDVGSYPANISMVVSKSGNGIEHSISASYINTGNTWNNLVASYNGGIMQSTAVSASSVHLYVNGIEYGQTSGSSVRFYNSDTSNRGDDSTSNTYFGYEPNTEYVYITSYPSYYSAYTLGMAMVYKRTLSQAEVQQNFQAQKTRFGLI